MTFSIKTKNCPFCGQQPSITIKDDCNTSTILQIRISCCVEKKGKIEFKRNVDEIQSSAQVWIDENWNYREKIQMLSMSIDHSLQFLENAEPSCDAFLSLADQLQNDVAAIEDTSEIEVSL